MDNKSSVDSVVTSTSYNVDVSGRLIVIVQCEEDPVAIQSAQNYVHNRRLVYPTAEESYSNCMLDWQQCPAPPLEVNSSACSCGYPENNSCEQIAVDNSLLRDSQQISNGNLQRKAESKRTLMVNLQPTVNEGNPQMEVHRTMVNPLTTASDRNLQKQAKRKIVIDNLEPTVSGRNSQKAKGHRIVVTNLRQTVSAEDIRLLFAEIENYRSSRLICQGVAEVTYGSLDSALAAMKLYHNGVLDGQPMLCYLINNKSSAVKKSLIVPNPDIIRNVLFE